MLRSCEERGEEEGSRLLNRLFSSVSDCGSALSLTAGYRGWIGSNGLGYRCVGIMWKGRAELRVKVSVVGEYGQTTGTLVNGLDERWWRY